MIKRLLRNLVLYPFGIIGMILLIIGFVLFDIARELIKTNQQQEH